MNVHNLSRSKTTACALAGRYRLTYSTDADFVCIVSRGYAAAPVAKKLEPPIMNRHFVNCFVNHSATVTGSKNKMEFERYQQQWRVLR